MTAPDHRARSWLARLAPYAVALVALPLLAPTCGGQSAGVKPFSKKSLIIPMDGCYQYMTDGTGQTATRAGCGATSSDAGDVIRAYGLVYQLVRAGVPVYWVIQAGKTSLTGVDLSVSLAAGAPVVKYNWADAQGAGGARPPNNTTSPISYTGGPFVVDGSDFDAANAVLQGSRATFGTVNVHVAQVAFQGNVAKVFAGGFAGSSTIPPRLALLNMPGGDGRYADHVLEGYLIRAGLAPACVLNNPPCADNSAGVAAGPHGNIYDRLEAADFLPPTCALDTDCGAGSTCTVTVGSPAVKYCDWKSTSLYRNGYRVLWLPHWTGVNSCEGTLGSAYTCGSAGNCSLAGGDACSCVTCGSGNAGPKLTANELDAVLATLGGYVQGGNDLFGECAGIGTLEGNYDRAATPAVVAAYGDGSPASRFQTTSGVTTNEGYANNCTIGTAPADMDCTLTGTHSELYSKAGYSSPFLQLADFPFEAQSGAIETYRPATNGSAYRNAVQPLISTFNAGGAARIDLFTLEPAGEGRGNVVYLAGHDYSGNQGTFEVAGTRLVLNTLFNLGGGCKPRLDAGGHPVACTQSKNLGTCSAGTWQCCSAADVQKGYCSVAESSPGASDGEPVCRPVNDVPGIETCNGLDDDCDGIVDNHLTDAEATTATHCYPGAAAQCAAKTGATCPAGTTESAGFCCKGVCHPGTWSCGSGAWSCIGAGLPGAELCNGLDDNCDGTVDEAAGLVPPGGSTPGQVVSCYTGPSGTAGVGLCRAGSWACPSATWVCQGQVLPAQERCEGTLADYNCNGIVGDGCDCVFAPPTSQACAFPTYATGHVTPGIGICRAGTQTCVNQGGRGVWAACTGQVLPHLDGAGHPAEICGNGLDDDCNGIIDDPDQCDCQAGDTQPCYPAATAGCAPKSGSCAAGTTERDGMCCVGVCAPGVHVCVAGKYASACTSAVTPAAAERCNGKNDTCSAGWTNDDSAPCPTPLACVNGVCTIVAPALETPCKPGYVPQGPVGSQTCVAASCPDATPPHVAGTPCPPGTTCGLPDAGHPNGTTCVDPCAGKVCAEGAYCTGGACVGGGCTGLAAGAPGACTGSQVCRNGACQADPCASTTCPAGTFCRGNFGGSPPVADCVRPCAAVVCPYGQACGADGFCAADPCATVTCPAGQVCQAGGCVADRCPAGSCGAGQMCEQGALQGTCVDDPCDAISCPVTTDVPPQTVGVCVRGQCQSVANLSGYGPSPSPKATTKSGCGCGGGDATPTALLLALLALPLARRRERRVPARGAALPLLPVLAALLLLGAGACSKSKTEKPSCETCGGNECVDVRTSAANCGSCGRSCGGGYVCADSRCLTAAVVPVIDSVTPSLVYGRADLTVTGSNFAQGALLRALDALPQTTSPASGVTPTQLQATVDLTAVAAGTLQIQVLNPDPLHPNTYVTSNVFRLGVVTPTPTIATVCKVAGLPTCVAQGPAGTTVPVRVTGTNFTSNAVCVQRAGTAETVIVPQAGKTSTVLTCDLDLRTVAPGFLDVLVQNENGVRSAAARFEAVNPGAPTVSGVSPSTAQQGSEEKLLVTGSGFVPGGTVEIAPSGGSTWTPLLTDYVYATSLRATLSLQSYAAGAYQVHVVTPGAGGGTSNAVPFTVAATAPVATLLTVTPATPVLGQTGVGFTLVGAGFSPGCVVQIQPPGGAFRTASLPGAVTASQVQATSGLDVAGDTFGTWDARASCTTGCGAPPCLTAALPFAVATNQASLLSVSPAGAEQGTTASISLSGSTFLSPGMTVTLDGGAGVPATVTSATSATASIPLAGVNTGVHLLRAVNASAPASNPIAFSVTAGAPSISAVAVADADPGACTPTANCASCAGASCGNPGACAVQQTQTRRVLVTISGANFGTGVSTVFVSSVLTGKVDLSTQLPAGSVVVADASTIRVTLDTTAVLAPQTYGLTVENPGKAPSATVPFKVSTSTCP